MCGIFGYKGKGDGIALTVSALHAMEYRGYDSAGIAFFEDDSIHVVKRAGKVSALEEAVDVLFEKRQKSVSVAIGHTRWATHGVPSDVNAHPHVSNNGSIAIVHNGIIENFVTLKHELIEAGYSFLSETDTEVFCNYIEYKTRSCATIEDAIKSAVRAAQGAYSIAVLYDKMPDTVYAVRRGAPLMLGVGEDGFSIASDVCALLPHTRTVMYLEDDTFVAITSTGCALTNCNTGAVLPICTEQIAWNMQDAQKKGYPHYMLKEIYEQPEVIESCMRGRVSGNTITIAELATLKKPKRLHIIACGTSYYAGLWGKYVIEKYAGIATEVEIASEYRYREVAMQEDTYVVAISQSGETADTLASAKKAKEQGYPLITLCNVMASSLTHIADYSILTQAGPEISVASTKAMTSQMLLLLYIALYWHKEESEPTVVRYIQALQQLPAIVADALPSMEKTAKYYAQRCAHYQHFFYLGRGTSYPLALEGALKLKELSYLHAEGYPAGEMKHGPIALIEDSLMTFALVTNDECGTKIQSAIAEIQARCGKVIAIGSNVTPSLGDDQWNIPTAYGDLESFIILPALQLFSYAFATLLGNNVDMPRNLAKSVTVE